MLHLQRLPAQFLKRSAPNLLSTAPVLGSLDFLSTNMLDQAGRDSESQLVPFVREVLDQDVRKADLPLLEVCDELLCFEVRENEGLAATSKARHLVDAVWHRVDGHAAEGEVEEYESSQTDVERDEGAGRRE